MIKWMCVVAVWVILSVWSDTTEGCSCLPRPDRVKFCTAAYAMKIKVQAAVPFTNQHGDRLYKIKMKRIYRINQLPSSVDLNTLTTAANSAACGVNLTVGTQYLIAGSIDNNTLRIGLCQLYKKWGDLTRQEKSFYKSCRIEIKCLSYKKNPLFPKLDIASP